MSDKTYSIDARRFAEATGNAPDIAEHLLEGFATRMDGKTDCTYYSGERIRSTRAVYDATNVIMDCLEDGNDADKVTLAFKVKLAFHIIDRLLDQGMLLPASPAGESRPSMRDARTALIRNGIQAWDAGDDRIRFHVGNDEFTTPLPFDPRKSAEQLAESMRQSEAYLDGYENIADEGTFERFPRPEWDYLYATGKPVTIGIGAIDGFTFAVMSDGSWRNESRNAYGDNAEALKKYAEGVRQ